MAAIISRYDNEIESFAALGNAGGIDGGGGGGLNFSWTYSTVFRNERGDR